MRVMRFPQRAALVVGAAAVIGVASTGAGLSPTQQDPGPTEAPSQTAAPTASPSDEPVAAGPTGPRWLRSACNLAPEQLRRTIRGYYAGRSPELTFVSKAPHFFGD